MDVNCTEPVLTSNPNAALHHFHFRKPESYDGVNVFELIKTCKPLDENSLYCNLLQCSHFRNTSLVAEINDQLAGFISAYRLPEHADTLFIWQIAVHPAFRGNGLAPRMLHTLLQRLSGIRYVHTSITEDNKASWQTFRRLALDLGADIHIRMLFDRERHFDNRHDSEQLVEIGPFTFFSEDNLEE